MGIKYCKSCKKPMRPTDTHCKSCGKEYKNSPMIIVVIAAISSSVIFSPVTGSNNRPTVVERLFNG